jgi:hypothetical protein
LPNAAVLHLPVESGVFIVNNDLILNIDKIHTTELGIERIKKNLDLDSDDVVKWCKHKIKDKNSHISRRGKN